MTGMQRRIQGSYTHMNPCQPITNEEEKETLLIPTTANIFPDVNQSPFPNGRFKVPYNGLCVGAPQADCLTHSV